MSAGPSRPRQGPGTRRHRKGPSTCHEYKLSRQRSARQPGSDEVSRHPRMGPITGVNLNFRIGSAARSQYVLFSCARFPRSRPADAAQRMHQGVWRGRQRVAVGRLSDHARPARGTRWRCWSTLSPPFPTPQRPDHAPPPPAPRLGRARTAGHSALPPPPPPGWVSGVRCGRGSHRGGGRGTRECPRAAYRGRRDGGGVGWVEGHELGWVRRGGGRGRIGQT